MAGIYIHIPFCKQKCTYCDFHFSTTFDSYRKEMISCINVELKKRAGYLENQAIETIYFGGGTPSLLTSKELLSIVRTIYEHFTVESDVEITLEANPDDITNSILSDWKNAGITRLSIGVQSFKASDLNWMNRAHSVKEAKNSILLAQKHGFTNITVDLIYGLPQLTKQDWIDHIEMILSLNVPHVSAYCLTIEDKTLLKKWVDSNQIKVATDDEQAAQFIQLLQLLERGGLEQYEISNFSKPGYRSRHNSAYWTGTWYLGVGPSAHSFNGNSRSWNVANNQSYMRSINEGLLKMNTEKLSNKDVFNESVLTGLRTRDGLNSGVLNQKLMTESGFTQQCSFFIDKGWMTCDEEIYTLTVQGMLHADHIASELFVL